MQDWIRNQEWSAELLVAAWVAIVVFFTFVSWEYTAHQHRRR